MSPKSLLRHPQVISPLSEFTDGHFHEVIEDPQNLDMDKVEKVILCTGKLFYELSHARTEEKYKKITSKTAILRVEQLYPFPKTKLAMGLAAMPQLKTVVWAQEEPQNMGAWLYIQAPINDLLDEIGKSKIKVSYAGRTRRASPATGSPLNHKKEQETLIDQAFKA